MGPTASQITSLTIVYSSVYSGTDPRKHQSSVSLAFVQGIHQWLVNSLYKWPVTRKMFPLVDVIMISILRLGCSLCTIQWGWSTDVYVCHQAEVDYSDLIFPFKNSLLKKPAKSDHVCPRHSMLTYSTSSRSLQVMTARTKYVITLRTRKSLRPRYLRIRICTWF